MGLLCRFTVVHHTPLDLNELVETARFIEAVCKTAYSHADVLRIYVFPASESSTSWQINHVERCWALGDTKSVLYPLGIKASTA